ncbi:MULTISPECIES: hypothetical protein [Streptomyces]|uniref:hypothetical protein n=1 Tax=Streptomyces TaxID=1883 RepID=UPI0033CA1990
MGIAVLTVVLQPASLGAHGPGALADAFDRAFWWSVALTTLAVPLCLLPVRPRPPSPTGPARSGAVAGPRRPTV